MGTKKQEPPFERCLGSAVRRLAMVQAALSEAQAHFQSGDMEGAYAASFAAADQSERLANQARALPCYTGHPRAKEMMEGAIKEAFPVEIGFTAEGWFCMRMPALLPKKNSGSPAYLAGPLYLAMKRFWQGKPPVRYPYNVAIFRHVYDRGRPERQYRDHDNTELSQVLDIVALYVMVDDSPLRCKHYYCSAPGSKDGTEVYVVPQDEFLDWLPMENNIPDGGVQLYGNKP